MNTANRSSMTTATVAITRKTRFGYSSAGGHHAPSAPEMTGTLAAVERAFADDCRRWGNGPRAPLGVLWSASLFIDGRLVLAPVGEVLGMVREHGDYRVTVRS